MAYPGARGERDEFRVLYGIGKGKAMKEIAKALHVSANSGTNSR
jgi:hypothetical protein